MKIFTKHHRAGLSLIDVLIVVTAITFTAAFFMIIYPRHFRVSSSANGMTCVNNLKQIHLAFRIYAGDNRDRFPMNISTNNTPFVNEATPVYEYFKLTENELGTPKVVICPSDKNRIAAKDFTNFSNSNVGYFIGFDSNEIRTNSMVAGDRNITNGSPPKDGVLKLTAKQKVSFTKEIHLEKGNIVLGDGSVHRVTTAQLRSDILPNTGFATNRIKLP